MTDINYIAQGTFGCVYNSDISCLDSTSDTFENKKKSKKYVSKVVIYDDHSESMVNKERTIGENIQDIFQYESFFAPILSTCPIDIGIINKEEIEKCQVIKKKKERDPSSVPIYVSNKLKFIGGGSICDYLDTTILMKEKGRKEIFETHLHLLKGLMKLSSCKDPIIHFDLKDNNIMFDDIYNIPVIIDFGLSFKISQIFTLPLSLEKLSNIFYTDEGYTPWTIEIHLLSFMAHNMSSLEEKMMDNLDKLNTVVDNFITSTEIIFETEEEKKDVKTKMYDYLKTFQDKSIQHLIEDLLQTWKSWDNYAVAMIYYSYLEDREKYIDAKDDYYIQYRTLLKKILLTRPRLEPKETYDAIISICEIKEIKEKT
jgi:serine/threonine protein kinase